MHADIKILSDAIIGEIFYALGFSKTGTAFQTFHWLFCKPADRISTICVTADRLIASDSFPAASTWILTNWCRPVIARGAETIPRTGPLLILSNHAGTYDTFVITSQAGRNDLKLIGSDVPFLKNLPNASGHIFFLSDSTQDRMIAARAGIRHLKQGGALLIYGTGLIDPDPEVYPDAEAWIGKWLPSIDLFLRTAPETQVVFAITSGVVARKWTKHPITWLKRIDWQKRRLAEFSQVLQQLFFPGSLYLNPHLSFSKPVSLEALRKEAGGDHILTAAIARGKALLADHVAWVKSLK